MNAKMNKAAQIFLGILSGIGIWIIGLLMSGKLALGELVDLYPAGKIVFAFPVIVTVLCIIIAKYSAKAHKKAYYISSTISLIYPLFSMLISSIFCNITALEIPFISRLTEISAIFFMIPYIPLYSIFYQITDITDQYLMAMSICVAIPLVGMLVSIKVYKNNCHS